MRRYQFYHSGYHGDQLTLRIVDLRATSGAGNWETTHDLTPATYARFVRLANSGRYDVSISEDTDGVAWELARRAAAPSAIAF